MKVLFVIPKHSNYYGGEKAKPRIPHVGIAYLSAHLKKEGHETAVFDCNVEDNIENLFGAPLLNQDTIGLPLYSLDSSSSYLFINKITSFLNSHSKKKISVIVGGGHVSVTGEDVLLKTEADFAVQGEGEFVLSELLTCLNDETQHKKIRGLIWRDEFGKIIINQPRDFIQDVNALPFPDYSIFKQNAYMSQELNELPINTSRGCPFDCLFCAVKIVAGKKFRPRSPENIMQEIAANYSKGIRKFYITDDAFNLDMKRAGEIRDLIIQSGIAIKFLFQNGLRADCLDSNLVEKLKKAGCTTIVLSAESGNLDILKVIKKKIDPDDIRRAVTLLDEAGIYFIVNFIIGHPKETYQKALDSIRLAKELSKKKHCATVMFFNLVPYPNTEVFDWVEQHGRWLMPKDDYFNSAMSDASPIFETPEFNRKERAVLLQKGNRIHNALLLRFIIREGRRPFGQIIGGVKLLSRIVGNAAVTGKFNRHIVYLKYLKKLYAEN